MSLMNGRFTTGSTILWILPAELDLSPLARNNTNTVPPAAARFIAMLVRYKSALPVKEA